MKKAAAILAFALALEGAFILQLALPGDRASAGAPAPGEMARAGGPAAPGARAAAPCLDGRKC
jgi:hypothetical protein